MREVEEVEEEEEWIEEGEWEVVEEEDESEAEEDDEDDEDEEEEDEEDDEDENCRYGQLMGRITCLRATCTIFVLIQFFFYIIFLIQFDLATKTMQAM